MHSLSVPGVATNSLYDLNAVWQDDAGRSFQLSELRGHPVVISMFFATCAGICVLTKDDLKTVEASLSSADRERTFFVLVTLEPERDTATALKDYRQAQNMASGRWRLLRGSPADTARLAAQLGVLYGRDHSGLFRHSSQLVVLDTEGKIVSCQDGIHADLEKTVNMVAGIH